MPLITTEVIIGKGKHTVTMMDIGEEVLQNDLPPGKGAADYEMLANQYPDSPLFSEGPFNSAKSYAEYYMMSVFGRGNDSSALQNFNPRSNPDFAGTSVDLSLRHASSADTNELVPEMYDDFKTNAEFREKAKYLTLSHLTSLKILRLSKNMMIQKDTYFLNLN